MSGRGATILSAQEAESQVQTMVTISVEVCSGAARFRVEVRAESIQQALSLVAGRHPGRKCLVKFPIEVEGFFVEGAAARVETVEQPEKLAA